MGRNPGGRKPAQERPPAPAAGSYNIAAGKPLEITRVRITDAGRRALTER